MSNTNNLFTIVWFRVILSNTNNFQISLFESKMGPKQVLSLQVRVNLGESSRIGASLPDIRYKKNNM